MRRIMCCLPLVLSAVAFAGEPLLVKNPDAYKTLVNPNCSHCVDEAKRRKDELKANDRVLCWIRGKYDGGAIPYRFFLNPYPVISDTYGVFVHDSDAGYVRGFAPSLDFTFYGWRNGVMVIKHKDGTLYSALSGEAFEGPNKGKRLTPVATITSDWGWWLEHYPDTVAYHMFEKYRPVDVPAKANESSVKSRTKIDGRLDGETRVLGVYVGEKAKAYRIDDLKKIHVLRDGNLQMLYHDKTRTAAAYSTKAVLPLKKGEQAWPDAVELSYDAKSADAPFVDKKSGSAFDIAGRCVSGKMKGHVLSWVDGVEVKWFAWSAEYPKTEVYGK